MDQEKENVERETIDLSGLKPVFLDTETTGFGSDDEIIDIAVIDFEGNVLFESLVKPRKKIPIDATAVHGISNRMVKKAPSWSEVWEQVEPHISGKHLGIYNKEYDLRLISQTCRKHKVTYHSPYLSAFCIMELFARYYGQWDDYHKSFSWQKLEKAGKYFNIDMPNSHRAKDDALLAREVFLRMVGHDVNQVNPEAEFEQENRDAILDGDKMKEISPKIINDNSKYKHRKYNTYGYYIIIGDNKYTDYFRKIHLGDHELEKHILNIEVTQKYASRFFAPLILESESDRKNDSRGWSNFPTHKDVEWREFNQESDRYWFPTLSRLVSRNKGYQEGEVLFHVECSSEGEYIYDTYLSDTIFYFVPLKARLLRRVKDYNFANLVKFNLECLDHIFDKRYFEWEPKSRDIYFFCNRVVSYVEEFSLNNPINPSGFRTFLWEYYPDIESEKNKLMPIVNDLWKHIDHGIMALTRLFYEITCGHEGVIDRSCISYCQIASAMAYRVDLEDEGYVFPSIFEGIDDPVKKLMADRIWYACLKREYDWQANKLATILNIMD
ncbi:MAG: 3'-5' exonuclease [Anaerolineales bacterium]|nr:3'-5' exonuclease [Anaerolineales bacterium]